MNLFQNIPVGTFFTVAGYDDMWQKVAENRAKNHGCGLLKRPLRLAPERQRLSG